MGPESVPTKIRTGVRRFQPSQIQPSLPTEPKRFSCWGPAGRVHYAPPGDSNPRRLVVGAYSFPLGHGSMRKNKHPWGIRSLALTGIPHPIQPTRPSRLAWIREARKAVPRGIRSLTLRVNPYPSLPTGPRRLIRQCGRRNKHPRGIRSPALRVNPYPSLPTRLRRSDQAREGGEISIHGGFDPWPLG